MPPENEPSTSEKTPASELHPVRLGLRMAWANRWPGLVLSLFAVGLLLCWWYVPTVQGWLKAVADFRDRVDGGSWLSPYSIVATALFGGLIPWTVQRLRPAYRHLSPGSHLIWYVAFWGYVGFETALFYDVQAAIFGSRVTLGVVIMKMLVDMILWMPLWAVPKTVVMYKAIEVDFSWVKLRRWFGGPWFRRDVVPIIITNWMVWIPAVCVIYSLPLALQLPMQNLVLCFWSLMLVLQSREQSSTGSSESGESGQGT